MRIPNIYLRYLFEFEINKFAIFFVGNMQILHKKFVNTKHFIVKVINNTITVICDKISQIPDH